MGVRVFLRVSCAIMMKEAIWRHQPSLPQKSRYSPHALGKVRRAKEINEKWLNLGSKLLVII